MNCQLRQKKITPPLLLLQVSNYALQLSSFFFLYRFQDLCWTLWLTHRRLSSQSLTVLLYKDMLIFPRDKEADINILYMSEIQVNDYKLFTRSIKSEVEVNLHNIPLAGWLQVSDDCLKMQNCYDRWTEVK